MNKGEGVSDEEQGQRSQDGGPGEDSGAGSSEGGTGVEDAGGGSSGGGSGSDETVTQDMQVGLREGEQGEDKRG